MKDLTDSLAWRQTRLTLVAAITLGVLLSLVMIAVDYRQTRYHIKQSGQELLLTATNTATQAAWTLDANLAEEVLDGLFAVQAVVYGELVTERGRLLATKDRRGEQQAPFLARVLGDELTFTQPLIWQQAFTAETQSVGHLQIRINGGLAGTDFQRRILWELILGVVRNILLAFVILYISSRLMTRPLAYLTRQLQQRHDRRFEPLQLQAGHERDELGKVVQAFNELADYLQQARAEQLRLSEIMAHHLQEPARRLVSFSQRLEHSLVLRHQQDVDLSIEFIKTQSLRLSELVRDVQHYLALEQLQPEAAVLHLERFVQDQLASPAYVQRLQPARVEVDIASDIRVLIPTVHLREVMEVLLNNALLYKKDGQPLHLQISAEVGTGYKTPGTAGEPVLMRIADNGMGLEAAYREQVFQLFARLVPGTSRYPGTGMGLAVVKKVLAMHHCSIWMEDSPLGGVCVVFELPRFTDSRLVAGRLVDAARSEKQRGDDAPA
ncbi:sensor histidine kinase [Marinospirillum alkaliphilum]|uniref:histidine kinase n=1 Tax=Marinospirillum alkaliphilum DSM 21637 TaxID=1122209 RepID=A0A1K1X2Q3_9GAMM|nr:HAMP domain-containing sensor histidine kinase [Marinospirillum alkaliphilum]SFX43922.1 HAMP domain-containing protein [Marinospirillum alkaliphilum DSM 21637]